MLRYCTACNTTHEIGQTCPRQAQGRWGGRRVTATRRAIYARDAGICHHCGRTTTFPEGHVDHVQARSEGGSDATSNLVWACVRCNVLKGAA